MGGVKAGAGDGAGTDVADDWLDGSVKHCSPAGPWPCAEVDVFCAGWSRSLAALGARLVRFEGVGLSEDPEVC